MKQNVWRRSIEQGVDASDLVWTELQANLYRLKRSFRDEILSRLKKITKKLDYVFQ